MVWMGEKVAAILSDCCQFFCFLGQSLPVCPSAQHLKQYQNSFRCFAVANFYVMISLGPPFFPSKIQGIYLAFHLIKYFCKLLQHRCQFISQTITVIAFRVDHIDTISY